MVLTVVIEDSQGTWYLRVHPTRSWDLSLQPIDRLKRTVCQGQLDNEGNASGGKPNQTYPEVQLKQLKSILSTICG